MVDDVVKYELKSVKAMRGTEARSITKWQKDGWELVDQTTGALHTTLNFRRVKPKVPWLPIAVLGGVLLLLAIIGGSVAALQGGDDKTPASSKPGATASAGASKAPSPDASASGGAGAEQTLTRDNSKELAALLAVADNCNGTIAPFATKYAERTVEFDGSIVTIGNHGDYKTRYDILLAPGDMGPESTRGPAFQFKDVNVFDLHLTGANAPNSVRPGDLLHVVARVDGYNATQCLFFLKPVSTGIR